MKHRLLGVSSLVLSAVLMLGVVPVSATEVDTTTAVEGTSVDDTSVEDESSGVAVSEPEFDVNVNTDESEVADDEDEDDEEVDSSHLYTEEELAEIEKNKLANSWKGVSKKASYKFIKKDEISNDSKVIGAHYKLNVDLPDVKNGLGKKAKDSVYYIEIDYGKINDSVGCYYIESEKDLDDLAFTFYDNGKRTITIQTMFGMKYTLELDVDYLKYTDNEMTDKPKKNEKIKLSFSKIPKKASITSPFTLTVKSNIPVDLNWDGRIVDSNAKKFDITIKNNDTYFYRAYAKSSGELLEGEIDIDSFKSINDTVPVDSGATYTYDYVDPNDPIDVVSDSVTNSDGVKKLVQTGKSGVVLKVIFFICLVSVGGTSFLLVRRRRCNEKNS